MMDHLSALAATLRAPMQGADAEFSRVITDSRQLQPGDLFVALQGERYDGHAFVEDAREKGAIGALVSQQQPGSFSQIKVPDTLVALQEYSAQWRSRFGIPVVAVTGSNGKTTTKQMLGGVFSARGDVLATQGNLNNHIGVPLTLLSLRSNHQTAVIEMGANHLGEIALLANLARPNVGVVTQAGDAHLEGFGSRAGVARGKGELFSGLNGGIAVINRDDEYFGEWRETAMRHSNSVITFGQTERADVHALNIEATVDGMSFDLLTPSGRAPVKLPLPGRHNVSNALAAAACAIALSMDVEVIAQQLSLVKNADGRLSWKRTPEGARLLDDSYNANPTSLHAAMELLASLPGRRVLIMGSMAELGPNAMQLHQEAGRTAKTLGIEKLLTTGALAVEAAGAFGEDAEHFADAGALVHRAQELLDKETVVLVKGSRSSRMERVVAALTGVSSGEGH